MNAYEIIITVIMALLGACFASFINAFALRKALGVSNISGRSKCPACEKTLVWHELIPIFSWLILLGKCRGCKKPISPRYLLSEVVCAGASALVFIRFRIDLMTPLAFGVIVILLAISLIDMSTKEIPNGLIIALIPLSLAAAIPEIISRMNFAQFETLFGLPETPLSDILFTVLIDRGIGFVAVSIPMFILAFAIGGFGGGDVKLMAVCGILLGWQSIILAFFLGVVTGGFTAIVKLLMKKAKRKDQMIFGHHLCFGIATTLLYGDEILKFYLSLSGF